jgi:hypothetical protein
MDGGMDWVMDCDFVVGEGGRVTLVTELSDGD